MTAAHVPTPADLLLRLRAMDARGVILLESLGPVVPYGRFSFLSALPTHQQHELPERPAGTKAFPAWLGGLKYEAAQEFGLSTHSAQGMASWWGFYPSGLVWDRLASTLEIVGEPHMDWEGLLEASPAEVPSLKVGPFGEDDVDFPAGVAAVKELIRAGECYQVNLSRGVKAKASGDPLAAYLRLREENPSPFMAFADLGAEVVVSCSPERLVLQHQGEISARPIAGTRRRGDTEAEDQQFEAELRSSPKEVAEHTMLVDLVRHDLGRVAAPGTVHVPDLMLIERYSHVMHLVSEIKALARPNLSVRDLVAANFPGGTITGAPKERVMEAIYALEPHPRGWYTGGLGIISGERVDLNILIRTAGFTRQNANSADDSWQVEVRAGGGIVIDAKPEHEAKETVHKAQALLSVLAGHPGRVGQAGAPPVAGQPWQPPQAKDCVPLRVLLLDNRDSFSYNLVHDLQALGATVDVRRQTEDAQQLLKLEPDAVLIGPGPGTPETSGCTLKLTRLCLEQEIPLLGVCLGHQALGQILGGRIERAEPVHGRPEYVQHSETGLFEAISNQTAFGRYHSLVVHGLDSKMVTATSADQEAMAMAVPNQPAWGVQFHPESVLSPAGRMLLCNWLHLSQTWKEQHANQKLRAEATTR